MRDAHYERLTANERLSLLIEALAWGDHAEATRLRDTCPEKTYRMPDAEYSIAVMVLHDLASTVTVFALENALRGFAALGVLACFGVLEDEQQAGQITDKVLEEAVRACQENIASYKGVYAAWEQFCAGVGVDANAVLKAFGVDRFAGFFPSVGGEDIAPNPDTAQSMIDLLNRHWDVGVNGEVPQV